MAQQEYKQVLHIITVNPHTLKWVTFSTVSHWTGPTKYMYSPEVTRGAFLWQIIIASCYNEQIVQKINRLLADCVIDTLAQQTIGRDESLSEQ